MTFTREEVEALAVEHAFCHSGSVAEFQIEDLQKLIALVADKAAKKEREACAEVCEAKSDRWAKIDDTTSSAIQACASAIRSRSGGAA